MAIKVNGTTVIDDSRNLQNVQGIKTINNTSILGSGNISAGASTTNDAVGTYGFLRGGTSQFSSTVNPGSTVSGSAAKWSNSTDGYSNALSAPSGTWRCMGFVNSYTSSASLFVRIS